MLAVSKEARLVNPFTGGVDTVESAEFLRWGTVEPVCDSLKSRPLGQNCSKPGVELGVDQKTQDPPPCTPAHLRRALALRSADARKGSSDPFRGKEVQYYLFL